MNDIFYKQIENSLHIQSIKSNIMTTIIISGKTIELSRKEFFCGRKQFSHDIYKYGWIAEWEGKCIGNETRNRGQDWTKPKFEPQYLTEKAVIKALNLQNISHGL